MRLIPDQTRPSPTSRQSPRRRRRAQKKSLKPCAQTARNPPPRLRASSRTSPARRDRCACPRPPACPARAKGSPARTPPSRAKHRRRVRWRPSAALPCIEPRTAVVDASPLRLRLRARARPRTCSRRRGPSLPGSGLGACSAPLLFLPTETIRAPLELRLSTRPARRLRDSERSGAPGAAPAGVRGSRGERGGDARETDWISSRQLCE